MRHLKRSFAFAVLALLMSVGSFAQDMVRPLRVAVARFQHETCTFCPGGDSDIERWTRVSPPYGGERLLNSGGYVGGFVKVAREHAGIELVGLTSPVGVWGGSSASWNTEESFDHFMGLMIADLERNMPVDGVFLALHGAMGVRNIPRPEAEIAKRIRQVVGPDVPIAATFDPHGNEDAEFLRWADMAFCVKRYPHYDSRLQGERAARTLIRTMRGDFLPTTATSKPGIVTATVLQWTGQSPSMDIMERARRWEAREVDAYVSVFYGFPWTDVPDIGAAIMVITNDDQELADRIAEDMSAYMWRVREEFAGGEYPLPDGGVRLAREAIAAGETPVVLADHSDRPGDATHILRELIAQSVDNVLIGTIRDEGVIEALASSGASAGDPFSMDVGGFTPSGGSPVRIEGTLVYLGRGGGYDNVAAVEFGDQNMLVITPALTQVTMPGQLRFGPIEPDDYDVFVIKSRVHFRRGFDETGYAPSIFIIEAPGPFVGTLQLDALDYQFGPISELYPFGMPAGRR
ncbi:M81 family metallopeptidase [Gemmatimonadota bacterium]